MTCSNRGFSKDLPTVDKRCGVLILTQKQIVIMGIVSLELEPEKYPQTVMTEDGAKLILMNGNQIDLYQKENKSVKKISGELSLDTSGEYLRIGGKPKNEAKDFDQGIERLYKHQIFYENAWFFLEHADEIMKDSRMFLAPVGVQNGIAYTGTSGFRHPTLGIYLEWWLNFSEAAIDGNGNPVWYISGSPLSGRNCCQAATQDGENVNIKQQTKFSDIWSSFCKVNNRYNDVKWNYEAFSLEEVLIRLKGEGYLFRIQEMKSDIRENLRRKEINFLKLTIEKLSEKLSLNIKKNKQLELKHNKDAIEIFMSKYSELEKEFEPIHAQYLIEYKDLKRQLHAGTLEGDYRVLLADISKDKRRKKHEMRDFANKFMYETFGKNPNGVSLKDVIKFSKKNSKKM